MTTSDDEGEEHGDHINTILWGDNHHRGLFDILDEMYDTHEIPPDFANKLKRFETHYAYRGKPLLGDEAFIALDALSGLRQNRNFGDLVNAAERE